MKKRVGILTSGGDCPGLNATLRGVAKALYQRLGEDHVEIIGISNGYSGLINGDWRVMQPSEFSGILTVGGTILGTKRTPFKLMRVVGEDHIDKVEAMKKNYAEMKLDCLLCLGGNGTHKTANLLSEEGLNIIGLPKTIDNDIFGTDVTFGFHSAMEIATEAIDRVHTTAGSHSRCMVVELMGNKAGWLTLYAGIAGGADIILIPELPYSIENVCAAIEKRAAQGKRFSILAVAEGAYDVKEARMKKKERMAKRAEQGYTTATNRIAKEIEELTGIETRICVPGHMQRGGSPSPYDRVLATQFGSYAAKMVEDGNYGITVAMKNNHVGENKLKDIAGKSRLVPEGHGMLEVARRMGVEPPVGNLLSSDVFYDKSGRTMEWGAMGVLAVEMETAALYCNAAEAGKRALTICTVSDSLVTGEELSAADRQTTFTRMMEIALETAVEMAKQP